MDEIEEIKQRLDVAEVVGSYIALKQSGRNLKASCPFHNEKSASFMVSPEKGIWHCFGCGEGGDIFKFVMRMEGVEFRPALEILARRAGVELKSRGHGSDNKLKDRLLSANTWAVKYFQRNLIENKRALEYVTKVRRLKRQTVAEFQIGFAPESWEGLVSALRMQGFSDDELVAAGLAARRASGQGIYDMFRGRLMFSISDSQGRPVGFTGRVLDESLPKYLNTPQTVLYDKSRAIYGLHLAKDAIRKADEVVLVEGNMDVVASHQAGVRQVVAASGTALTLEQLKTLGHMTKNIKLAFDQDAAGLKATERAIELAQKLGLTLKVVVLHNAKDPDELISRDPVLWAEAITKAPYVIDYLFERFKSEIDLTSAMGKRQYSDRLAANLHRLADPVEKDHYIQLLANLISATPEAVKQKVDELVTPALPRDQFRPVPTTIEPKNGPQMIEESLVSLLLGFVDARLNLDELRPDDFNSARCREIILYLGKHEAALAGDIAKDLPNEGDYVKILTLRGEEQFGSLAPADRSLEALTLNRRLQTLANKHRREEIGNKLREAEKIGDSVLALSLKHKYQELIDS
ncbi:MAG: DNA primase [Candidatus Saccharimonadia bacterium]